MSQTKTKKGISFPLLTAGLVFLFNPLFQTFDLLPDTVGYLLLIFALRPVQDEIYGFQSAIDALTKMLIISASRIPAALIVLGVRTGNAGERSITAVVLFVYLLLEVYFGTRAFRSLFDAFFGLSERYGVTEAGIVVKNGRAVSAAGLPHLTTAFFAVRGVMAFLPEALFLDVQDTSLSGEKVSILSAYYLPVAALSLIVSLVFGILWLSSLFRYFNGVKNASGLPAATEQAKAVHPSAYRLARKAYRRDRAAVLLLAASALFTADIYIDGVDVLPDFVSPLLVLLAVFLLRSTLPRRRFLLFTVVSALHLVAATVDFALVTRFLTLYDPSDLHRVRAADALYATCRITECVKGATTVLFALAVAHLAYTVFSSALMRSEGEGHSRTLTVRRYRPRFITVAVLGAVEVFFGIFDFFLKDITEMVEANEAIVGTGTVVIEVYGWFWLLAAAVSFIYFGYTYFLSTDIVEELHYAYDIDD